MVHLEARVAVGGVDAGKLIAGYTSELWQRLVDFDQTRTVLQQQIRKLADIVGNIEGELRQKKRHWLSSQ